MTDEAPLDAIDKLALNSTYGKHPKLHRVITSMAGLTFTPYEAAILTHQINIRTHPAPSDTLENLPYAGTDSMSVRKPFTREELFGPTFEGNYGITCNECGCEAPAARTHVDWHNKVADL